MNKLLLSILVFIAPLAFGQVSLTTGDHFWYKKSASGPNEIFKPSADVQGLLDDASVTNMRTTLGLVIGTNVQAYDAGLQSIAGLTTAANKGIYTTASDAYATFDLTTQGRQLLDDTSFSAMRTTLGIGTGDTVTLDALIAVSTLDVGAVRISASDQAIMRTESGGTFKLHIPEPLTDFDVYFPAGVSGRVAVVDDVNGLVDLADEVTGTLDDLTEGTTNKHFTSTEKTKLTGIEALADVTDAANVDAAGAVMNSDTSTAAMSFVLDEDAMSSNSDTKIPTQQSVKAYVDAGFSASGRVAQVVSAVSNSSASTTNQIPTDNTIPQSSEGQEYMTLTITPKSASSTLIVEWQGFVSASALASVSAAIFRDSGTGAVAATLTTITTAGYGFIVTVSAKVSSGSTSASTFKIRFGPNNASTAYVNRFSTGDVFGGVQTAFLKITEVY